MRVASLRGFCSHGRIVGDAKFVLAGLVALSTACGGDSGGSEGSPTTSDSSTTSTLSGSGGNTASTSATAQTTSSTDGASATASTSTTGGSGSGCSGAFGEPVALFGADTTGTPQSFTLTPDELEIYYVLDAGDGTRIIERRVRTALSVVFGAAEAVPELLDVCPTLGAALQVGTVDLSPDGLVAYIACEETVDVPTTLVAAKRTALGEPFVPDPTVLGTVGASFATADGLEGFSNTPTDLGLLDRHQRSSLTLPFSEAEPTGISLRSPDPSNDGLWLFGSVPAPGSTNGESHLAAAQRTNVSAPFSEPSVEGFPVPSAGVSYMTPTISADCRSLYFLRLSNNTADRYLMLAQR